MSLGSKQMLPALGLAAAYIAGFVPIINGRRLAEQFLGPQTLAIGAAIKFLPVLILGCLLIFKVAPRAAKAEVARFAKLVGIGLVFGSLGDFSLDFSDSVPVTFLLGLGSFLVGHLFYVWAFSLDQLALKPLVVAVFVAIPAFLLKVLWPGLPGDMVGPVVVYGVVLASMGLLAASRKNVPSGTFLFGLLGSIVFIVSDSVLAIDRFRSKLPYGKLAVMVTYYTAQLLIAKCASDYARDDVKTARQKARRASVSEGKPAVASAKKEATPAKTSSASPAAPPSRGRATSPGAKKSAKKAEPSPAKPVAVASSSSRAPSASAKKSTKAADKSPARSKTPSKASASVAGAAAKKATKKAEKSPARGTVAAPAGKKPSRAAAASKK